MPLPTITGVGRLTADPELRITQSGTPMCLLSIAFNSRKQDANGQWVDGDVYYARAVAWKQLAENAAESLSKGMEVLVTGELRTEQWEKDGQKQRMDKLQVRSIAPNLAFATARVQKATRDGSSSPQQSQRPQQSQQRPNAPQNDPWSIPAGDEPPF
jgi:single-strand DNA-binding protein